LAFAISRVDFAALSKGSGQGTTADSEIVEPFIAVRIDDEFHHTLSEQLRANMDAWSLTGVDAYVYRYRINDQLEPGVSQSIVVELFVGGADADAASVAP